MATCTNCTLKHSSTRVSRGIKTKRGAYGEPGGSSGRSSSVRISFHHPHSPPWPSLTLTLTKMTSCESPKHFATFFLCAYGWATDSLGCHREWSMISGTSSSWTLVNTNVSSNPHSAVSFIMCRPRQARPASGWMRRFAPHGATRVSLRATIRQAQCGCRCCVRSTVSFRLKTGSRLSTGFFPRGRGEHPRRAPARGEYKRQGEDGARGRSRTDTLLRAADFESARGCSKCLAQQAF